MKRLILCDDEPHILEGLRHLLRTPDRTVDVASSGKEALQLIAAEKPDLLIVDIMMPEMSGLDVVASLRADDATKDLRIIILTAKGQARDAAMAQDVWGATLVAKPFSPKHIRQLVQDKLTETACPPQTCVAGPVGCRP